MKHILFTAFMLACYVCNAQQLPDYCVYLVKGQVTVAKPGTKPAQIKQKQFLYKNEVLSLAKNAEVTLINKEDKLLVWSKAGAIKVSGLSDKFNPYSPSVTKSYLNLAFHELLDPDYDYSSFNRNNVGGVRGGVSRGDDCDNLIFPVRDLKAAEDSILFKWHSSSPLNDYALIIYDSSAKEIINMPVKDTQYKVNTTEILHGNTGKYYWVVKGKEPGCESDPIAFEIMNRADEQKLIPTLILQKGSEDVLSQLQIIDALERDKWIYTALKYYAVIVQKNLNDKPLAKSYIVFLLKYGFDKEAHELWEKNFRIDTISK